MKNNRRKMRDIKVNYGLALAFVVGLFFFGSSLASAADPGHGSAVIGSGTFESGNYIFPANLDIAKNFSVGGSNFFVNNVSGFVGIGTTSPIAKLDVKGTTALNPSLNSTDPATVHFTAAAGGLALAMGYQNYPTASTWWMQARNNGANGFAYPIALNPLGGNIGIGTTEPTQLLDITGTMPALSLFDNTGYTNARRFNLKNIQNNGLNQLQVQVVNDTTGLVSVPVTIQSNGNVGIGTTTPSKKLSIQSNDNQLLLNTTNEGNPSGIYYYNGGAGTKTNWYAGAQKSIDNGFEITPSTAAGGSTFSNPALTVLSTGKVGIGTTTPGAKLDILDTASNNLRLSYNTTSYGSIYVDSAGSLFLQSYNPAGTNSMYLRPDGTLNLGDLSADSINIGRTDYNILTTVRGYFSVTNSTSSQGLYQNANANVGIGTTSPNSKLEVAGTFNASVATGSAVLNSGGDFKVGI